MSSQSPALLFGQDLRPQEEQGAILCLLQERFRQGHLPCHYLLMDQADIWILCVSSLIRRPSPYNRLKLTMLGPLLLLRPSSLEFPYSKFYQPATGSHIIPSHSSGWGSGFEFTCSP